MRFLGYLVARRIVRSIKNQYLESGHTHEDVDQIHGQVCREVRRHRCLKTPNEFQKCLDDFLKHKIDRPHEKDRFCIQVGKVRDWATWLQPLKIHLAGVGGPSAPHSFEFVRRQGALRHAESHTSMHTHTCSGDRRVSHMALVCDTVLRDTAHRP